MYFEFAEFPHGVGQGGGLLYLVTYFMLSTKIKQRRALLFLVLYPPIDLME